MYTLLERHEKGFTPNFVLCECQLLVPLERGIAFSIGMVGESCKSCLFQDTMYSWL